jgi:serine acetyltransferase
MILFVFRHVGVGFFLHVRAGVYVGQKRALGPLVTLLSQVGLGTLWTQEGKGCHTVCPDFCLLLSST